MNYSHVAVFFENYSLITIIISAAVFIITVVSEKIFSEKIPSAIKTYAPFLLGVLFNILYNAIFVKENFNEDVIVSGLICGSLSGAFSSVYYRIREGRFYLDDITFLSNENILKNTIKKEELEKVNENIRKILDDTSLSKKEQKELVTAIILENACREIPEKEARDIAELLIKTLRAQKR